MTRPDDSVARVFCAAFSVVGVSAVYYLAGAFITGTFDVTQWDSFGKMLTVLVIWLPAALLAACLGAGMRISL